jgi:hypothetical protein
MPSVQHPVHRVLQFPDVPFLLHQRYRLSGEARFHAFLGMAVDDEREAGDSILELLEDSGFFLGEKLIIQDEKVQRVVPPDDLQQIVLVLGEQHAISLCGELSHEKLTNPTIPVRYQDRESFFHAHSITKNEKIIRDLCNRCAIDDSCRRTRGKASESNGFTQVMRVRRGSAAGDLSMPFTVCKEGAG